MDLVTQNLVSTFREEQSFPEDISESTGFEHFANYCVVSKEYADDFDPTDLHVAGGNDLQLDGVCILVNGLLITSVDEVDDLLDTNNHIDAEFIFVQAKSGKNFEGAAISDMFFGVRELCSQTPSLPRNDALQKYRKNKNTFHPSRHPQHPLSRSPSPDRPATLPRTTQAG